MILDRSHGVLDGALQKQKNPLADQRVCFGAKDGIRTRDPDLGKVVLYQLSYFRIKECEYTKA